MSEHYASGVWFVTDGQADAFVERWTEFLQWTRDNYGDLEEAQLLRSQEEPNRFVSFAGWSSAAARTEWRDSDGFAKRFGACRELCDHFFGGAYERVART